jgi:hypothetical protein
MLLKELKQVLKTNPTSLVRFRLPDGSLLAAHAHITEVGLVTKSFIDCGGTTREERKCQLQSWVAEDYDHRLRADKLLSIIDKAQVIVGNDDLPVDVEHDVGFAAAFPISSVTVAHGEVIIESASRHTQCLAPEKCCPPQTGSGLISLGRKQ